MSRGLFAKYSWAARYPWLPVAPGPPEPKWRDSCRQRIYRNSRSRAFILGQRSFLVRSHDTAMNHAEAADRAALLHRVGAAYVDALRAGDFEAIPYAEDVVLTNFKAMRTKGPAVPLVGRASLKAKWWDEMRAHYVENGQRPALTLHRVSPSSGPF